MTDKELKKLTARHFARSKKLTFYHVCGGCKDYCAFPVEVADYLKNEKGGEELFQSFARFYSPLPLKSFRKLVKAKIEDPAFLERSINREFYEDFGYDD